MFVKNGLRVERVGDGVRVRKEKTIDHDGLQRVYVIFDDTLSADEWSSLKAEVDGPCDTRSS